MSEEQPYKVFPTEKDYRDHIAEVLGPRVGREQRKTSAAEAERDELRERADELERALAEARQAADGTGTPLSPTNTPLRRADKLDDVLHELDRSCESGENGV